MSQTQRVIDSLSWSLFMGWTIGNMLAVWISPAHAVAFLVNIVGGCALAWAFRNC